MGTNILPRKITHQTQGAILQAFTWKDRIRLLLGYRVLIRTMVLSQHSPGMCHVTTEVTVTPYIDLGKARANREEEIREALNREFDRLDAKSESHD